MAHIIQNFDALADGNGLRRDALEIAEAGYAAVEVGNALRQTISRLNLDNKRVFFVGVGKCSFKAAPVIEELFGDSLIAGIALDVSEPPKDLKKIETLVGTHPLPSGENERATKHILQFLSERTGEDTVVMLISGGGSTLLCAPEAPMTHATEAELFKELTAKGATIQELNTVRKHLSHARGGGLARAAYPAEVISLIVSDVPKNDIAFVSSGPTVLDTSTTADAKAVLERYDITLPDSASFIEHENDAKYFEHVTNTLFLSNQNALVAMKETSEALGYATEIVDDHFSGEAREIARLIAEKLHTVPAKTVLLYAGESTVTGASSASAGGRNQELALAGLQYIQDEELILPFASDGHDNSDHAGAIADTVAITHAQEKNVSIEQFLDDHRSYDFYQSTHDAVITGYTGTNVSDLIVALKH